MYLEISFNTLIFKQECQLDFNNCVILYLFQKTIKHYCQSNSKVSFRSFYSLNIFKLSINLKLIQV